MVVSEMYTCSPGLRGSINRRTESALPNTTLQCGAGIVVTAVMGFLPSTASYERICFPRHKELCNQHFKLLIHRIFDLSVYYLYIGPTGVRCYRSSLSPANTRAVQHKRQTSDVHCR